ncbi:MAG: hypothetical protein FWD57_04310 [Polyangiaceae bacterium]|nr:hypothetical protein [Polyangiaceae bacterium]
MFTAGCDESKPVPAPVASASAAPETPQEPAFEFPDPEKVQLARVGDWVDRARSRLPEGELGKINDWLSKSVKVPVQVRGESRKTLLDSGNLTCGYTEKLTCTFPAKVSEKALHFVASTVTCLGNDGASVKQSDWKIAPDTPRGKQVDLPIDDLFLRDCWDKGGETLRMEVIGTSCVVPFPRQVRCAGEFNTCLHRCKGAERCEQTCDVNRTNCLAVCPK